MRHKFLGSFLYLTLTASMLTGCGQKNGETEGTPTPVPTTAGNDEKTPTPTQAGTSDNEEKEDDQKPDSTVGEDVPKGEPTVIRWGHNWISEMDTTYKSVKI